MASGRRCRNRPADYAYGSSVAHRYPDALAGATRRPILRPRRQDRPLNKAGRRLRTRQLDALGYNGETSDPLYKHWPFFLGPPRRHRAAATASTTTHWPNARLISAEFDNYHDFYRSTEIATAILTTTFAGPDVPPRWSLLSR